MKRLLFLVLLFSPAFAHAQGQSCPLKGSDVNLGRVTAEHIPYSQAEGVLPQDHWVDSTKSTRCILFGCETLTEVGQGETWAVLEIKTAPDCGNIPKGLTANQCEKDARIAALPEALTVAKDAAAERCAEEQANDPVAREAKRQKDRADALKDIKSFPKGR